MSTKLILTTLILFVAVPSWVFAQSTAWLDRQVVQTLIDSERRKQSTGTSTLKDSEVENHLINSTMKRRTYAKTHKPQLVPPGGVYRITVNTEQLPNLTRQWWKRIVTSAPGSKAELWYRPVRDGGGNRVELLARRKIKHFLLEIIMVFDSVDVGQDKIFERFDLFLANASKNQLFEEQPKVVTQTYSGTWAGPMTNTRGESAVHSTLIITAHDDSSVTGAWHAGWKLEYGRIKENVITWRHRKLFDGCRDYDNRMVVSRDGLSASLSYNVIDRCREPHAYSGKAQLKKQVSAD